MKQQNPDNHPPLIKDTGSGKKFNAPLLLAPVCKQGQIGVTRQCTPRLPLNVENGECPIKVLVFAEHRYTRLLVRGRYYNP